MKKTMKISKVILILAVVLSFSACENFLDRYPTDSLSTAQVYSNIETAESAVIAVYDLLSDTYLFGRNASLRGSLKGADFFHFIENPNKRFDKEYKYVEISSSAGYAGYLWNYSYKTIAACNIAFSQLTTDIADEATINHMKAQLSAAKAISYLELLRSFCYPLWMAKEDVRYAQGVPLLKTALDNSSAIETPPGRASLQDSYDYVEELLLEAIDLIDKSKTEKQFFTEQGLWAILAKYYLYVEEWELARDAALEAERLGGTMIPKAEFIANMTTRFNPESVFEIYFDVNDNPGTSCLAYYAFKSVNEEGKIDENSIGYGDYGASNAFIGLFTDNDIRNDLFKEDKKGTNRAYHKYIGIESELIHDVPYIRLPEVLLIAAEAYSELDKDIDALNYLNKVFTARTDSTLDLSGLALKNEIFDERRRELALEGHELFDYLRKGKSFTRDSSHPSPLTIDPVNGRSDSKFHRVVYPIPQPEMDANSNLRDEQNPGYAAYQGSD